MAAKHRKRRKKKTKKPLLRALVIALIVLVAALLLWHAHTAFSDRHWNSYKEAGDRAYARGNYAWAEKMYGKALREARDLDPHDSRVVKSLVDLGRVYKAQERDDLAAAAIARAREIRALKK